MASLFFLRSALRPHWLITVLLLGLTGCESESGHRHGPPPDGTAEARPAIPEMAARTTFLAGQLDVETVLNRTGFAPRGGKDEGGGGPGGGARGGGERGRGRRGGGGGRGGPMGESSMGGRGGDSDGPAPNLHASNEAPVSFHLRLTNHGTAPVDVEVLDFNSELGNFVVQPAKITVPPGESIEAEPMISRLGVRSAEIPLAIRLRAAGHTEPQTLTLRVIEPPPALAPGVPAAPAPVSP